MSAAVWSHNQGKAHQNMFVPLLVTAFLGRAVRQYGKKVAVVDEEKRFTYAQFGERVNRLSNGLFSRIKLGWG